MCLALLFSGVANAQLEKPEQKCVNSVNKGASKVAKAQGGDNSACIKNWGKGKTDKLGSGCSTAECCLTADAKGKVNKAITKIKVSDCVAVPGVPVEIIAANIGALMVEKELTLIHAVFGTDLDEVLVVSDKAVPGSKDAAKCQADAAKRMQKCQDSKFKNFNKCKKNAVKTNVENAPQLQAACLESIDDGGKCGADMAKKCSGTPNDDLFPGCAGQNLATCLDVKVECELCKALNRLDGLSRDCDDFDDGVINETCEGAPPIGTHKCVYDPNSTVVIDTQALPLPPFPASGSVDISCGNVDANGKAPCDCELQSFEPINIQGVGFICFTPGTEVCVTGEIECDGGNALDIDMDSDHNIGLCTSSADCEVQCAAHCGALVGIGPYSVFNEACEGYCENSTNPGAVCTDDPDCPGGSCPGPTGAGPGGIHQSGEAGGCQCDCNAVGGGASVAGTLQCNLGVTINVEDGAPCGDGDVIIAVGNRCIPLTTATSTSVMHNTNNTPAKDFPVPGFNETGVGVTCPNLAGSVTAGIQLVGAVNFFDSTIGDLQSQLVLNCQ
jgi:hypothetical protein